MASISIALASFNGINYITKQLDSLRNQTLSPTQVIIADDKSTDGTYDFIVDYISKYNLSNWIVYQNEHNLGIHQNFRQLLRKCKTDYIFTCDQDDIWMPEKIEIMAKTLNNHPEINLLTSNYIGLVNDKPAKIFLKNNNRNDGEIIPFKLQETGFSSLRQGCMFAFRRKLIDKFDILDIENQLHDSMLWKYAIVSDSLYLINKQLIYWVRHEGVATGIDFSGRPNISQRISWSYDDEETYKKFIEHAHELEVPEKNVKFMHKMINFIHKRRNMLKKRNVFLAAFFVLFHMKYYPTLRNALSDIYAMIFLNK